MCVGVCIGGRVVVAVPHRADNTHTHTLACSPRVSLSRHARKLCIGRLLDGDGRLGRGRRAAAAGTLRFTIGLAARLRMLASERRSPLCAAAI